MGKPACQRLLMHASIEAGTIVCCAARSLSCFLKCIAGHSEHIQGAALQVTRVTIPPPKDGKTRDYAFVEFADSQIASSIIDGCERGQKPSMEGSSLEVSQLPGRLSSHSAKSGCCSDHWSDS